MFLGNSQSIFFEVISQVSDAYLVIDCVDKTEKLSPSLCSLLEIKHKNPNFSDISECVSKEQFLELQSQISSLISSSKSFQSLKINTKNKPLSCSGEIITIAKHKYILLRFEDITEKEEFEKKLDFSVSLQKQFLESSTSAVAIYGEDTKLLYYNKIFSTLWNLEEDWLDKNPTYGEILEKERENRLLPEQTDFQEFKTNQLKLFKNLTDADEDFLYCPNGKTIRRMIMPHDNGGLICTFDDVSDKMALEISYNTLIAVQKETLDNLKEGVAFFGENGLLKLFNTAFSEIIGFEKERLDLKPHFSEILESVENFSGDWENHKDHLIKVFSLRKTSNEIIEWQKHRVINLSTMPLPDGGLLCSFVDITDSMIVERTLREKNRALEQADKLKTDFLENISYELRSPLTSIMGFAEALKYNYFGDLNPKQHEYIGHICSASETLKELIDTILFLASIEAGYVELNIKNVDVTSMIEDMVSKRKNELLAKEISVEIECPKDTKTMFGDREHIQHALLQIFTNAIAFSPIGETIKIGVERKTFHYKDNVDENAFVLWVKDNGVGVSADEQKTFFEWFNKLDVGKAGISGVGIGLSLAKRIVTLHGGDLLIESEKGKGTKVIFHIPQSVKVSEEEEQKVAENSELISV